jgi:hydroxypyruvate reductase
MEPSAFAAPCNRAAELALAVYLSALNAVRADTLVRRALRIEGDFLAIGDVRVARSSFDRVVLVGAGKAACGMARAVEEVLSGLPIEGVVVTKHGHADALERVRVLEAGHPVPDAASVAGGRAVAEAAAAAGERDLALCLISGGASAIVELPEEGVSLEDLRATTEALLRAGAPIEELNAVRATLSRLKAGGLARLAAPARVVALVLSDVLGNPLEVIGSGPCVGTAPDPARARQVLRDRGLWDRVPQAVRDRIDRAPAPGPARRSPADHVLVGDLWSAIEAAKSAAVEKGLRPIVLTGWLQGEAREVGGVFGAMLRDLPRTARDTGFDCLIAGGETTVTVTGTGVGGRSQELALAAARAAAGVRDVALIAAGTDGTDGPTDAAGALVDGDTLRRGDQGGRSAGAALAANDSHPYLEAAGALVKTGPTHSNVGDLVIAVTAR